MKGRSPRLLRCIGLWLVVAWSCCEVCSANIEVVRDTKFSHKRGFYEAPFSLEITCETPDAAIFFTTDGSPASSTNGVVYSMPLLISRTTVIRARAEKAGLQPSNVDTQTYLFLNDVITQSPDGAPPPDWPATWGGNKVNYGMDPEIVTKLPWSATISNDLRAIPSMSLVMRLEDLFDAHSGIYANPVGEGREWERSCSVELIYPDSREGFGVRAGVRIRGGFSRDPANPKHSFRFLMRGEYGESKLRFPLFGPEGAREIDKFDLRTAQDGSWAFQGDPHGLFMNDPFARDTLLALGQPSERGDWYHLYINGLYWGIYNSCERPEASYAASYFGGEPEDWDVLKPEPQIGYIMKVTDGEDGAWIRLWQAATNGFASNASYFQVQGRNVDGTPNPSFENLLDVTNLIDYMLVIFWIGDYDGPLYGSFDDGLLNNYYAIRDRTGRSGGFRFLTHDAELSLGSVDENRISITTIGDPTRGHGWEHSNPYYLWTRLLPNAEFKMLVADRIQKHFFGQGALTREAAIARFIAHTNELDRAMTGESARWGDARNEDAPITPNDWRNAIGAKMENYFPFRAQRVLDQLRETGLFPSLLAPTISRGEGAVSLEATMSHANESGQIVYTTDGTDPRAIGGELSPAASTYDAPILIDSRTTVRARVREGDAWSPLSELNYYAAGDFNDLKITELHYNPPGMEGVDGEEYEFLELKNTGTQRLDLGGLSFSGINFAFTNGTYLEAGAFFVLGRNAIRFAERYSGRTLYGVYTGKLDNSGETILIKTAANREILSISYGDRAPWPLAADGHGFSVVLSDPRSKQARASSAAGGSPGADDPPSVISPILINEVLTRTELPSVDAIELYNPNQAEANVSGWYLSDDASAPRKFRIPDGTVIEGKGYLVLTEADFNAGVAGFSLSSEGDEVYLVSGSRDGLSLTGYSHGFEFSAAETGVSFGRYINGEGEELFLPQIATSLGEQNLGPPVVGGELNISIVPGADEICRVRFERSAGAQYRIESTADLSEPQWAILTNLPAVLNREEFELTLKNNMRAQFLRVLGAPPASVITGP